MLGWQEAEAGPVQRQGRAIEDFENAQQKHEKMAKGTGRGALSGSCFKVRCEWKEAAQAGQ